jgi:malate/lactate dehydrogenase
MQTITTKTGVVVQCGTRADMASAVPTVYLRAFTASGRQRIIHEDSDGTQTVMFEGDYPVVKDQVHGLEVRVRDHGLIPTAKVPLDDAQQEAFNRWAAERLADGRG